MSTTPQKTASKSNSSEAPVLKKSTPAPDKPALIAEELEIMLHTAFVNARARRHEFITVEHLLYGLADAPTSREALIACGADVEELKSRLSVFIDENTPVVDTKDDVDTQPTLGFQRVIQRAIMQVQSVELKRRQVGTGDTLLGIYGERDSHACYYLQQQGVSRLDMVNFLTHGIRKEQISAVKRVELSDIADKEKAGRDFHSFVVEATQTLVQPSKRESERPKLFISYSHVDTICLDRLLVHLKPLERANTVVCWSDKRLRTGDKWKTELERNLDEAVIAILLVSADFLASDFIVNNELPPLLVKADAKGLRILPVILKPCGFRRDSILSTFQSANDPTAPLLGLSPMEQEAIYDKIADEVAREIASRRV